MAGGWKEARDIGSITLSIAPNRGRLRDQGRRCGRRARRRTGWADISIAARSAKIVDAHTRLALPAGDHAAIIWPCCADGQGEYYLLLCEPLSGEEAERIGLFRCVFDATRFDTGLKVAIKLAAGAQSAIRLSKYALNNWLRTAGPIFDAVARPREPGLFRPEVVEGIAAFREKRSIVYNPSRLVRSAVDADGFAFQTQIRRRVLGY